MKRATASRTPPDKTHRELLAAKRLAGDAAALLRRFKMSPAPIAGAASDCSVETNVFDVAWDGHRVLVARAGDSVRAIASDYREWAEKLPGLQRALRSLTVTSAVLDGYLVALDEHGRPSFDSLKRKIASGNDAGIKLVVLDLLHWDGEDLTSLALFERLTRLQCCCHGARDPIVVSERLSGALESIVQTVEKLGLGGVLVRDRQSAHPSTRPALIIGSKANEICRERSLSPAPNVTNAGKSMFPRDGLTKVDVVRYYDDISNLLLPYLKNRPVVAQRWPDGIDDFTWYQHRVPPRAPDYVRAVFVEGNRRILLESRDAIVWMVNQAALTLHGFVSRIGTLENPDWLLLDLDPGERTTRSDVARVAACIRRLLELLELSSVVKTSGQKGIHVLVPLAKGAPQELVGEAGRLIASMVARLLPDIVSIDQEIDARRGRLYLDTTQGYVGKILVLPYSLRAKDGAPCSTPISWDEVTPSLDPGAFTLKTLRTRLDKMGDLAAPLVKEAGADIRVIVKKLRASA